MTQTGYLLLGLTAVVAALVSVLVYAVMRLASGARDARLHCFWAASGDVGN